MPKSAMVSLRVSGIRFERERDLVCSNNARSDEREWSVQVLWRLESWKLSKVKRLSGFVVENAGSN